jgi:hypothetical protein
MNMQFTNTEGQPLPLGHKETGPGASHDSVAQAPKPWVLQVYACLCGLHMESASETHGWQPLLPIIIIHT